MCFARCLAVEPLPTVSSPRCGSNARVLDHNQPPGPLGYERDVPLPPAHPSGRLGGKTRLFSHRCYECKPGLEPGCLELQSSAYPSRPFARGPGLMAVIGPPFGLWLAPGEASGVAKTCREVRSAHSNYLLPGGLVRAGVEATRTGFEPVITELLVGLGVVARA